MKEKKCLFKKDDKNELFFMKVKQYKVFLRDSAETNKFIHMIE